MKTAAALKDVTSAYDDGKTAICFMGHGTEADSNGIYEMMENNLNGCDRAAGVVRAVVMKSA